MNDTLGMKSVELFFLFTRIAIYSVMITSEVSLMEGVPVTSHIRPNIELFTLLQTDKCLTHGMPFDNGDRRAVHFWDFLPFKSASVPEED